MSIAVRWDNPEKTLLIVTFKGKWPGRDLAERLDQAWAGASAVGQSVYAIMDFRFAARLPPDSALALLLAWNTMPANIAAVILLGMNSTLFSAAANVRNFGSRTKLLYAASMQAARQLIKQHQQVPADSSQPTESITAEAAQPASETDGDQWQALLKPFAATREMRLTTYERNGAPASSATPYILQANRFYVLTSSDSPEVVRIQNNPYVKIEVTDVRPGPTLAYPARIELVAFARAITLEGRRHLVAAWQQKYNDRIVRLEGQRLIWLDLQPEVPSP